MHPSRRNRCTFASKAARAVAERGHGWSGFEWALNSCTVKDSPPSLDAYKGFALGPRWLTTTRSRSCKPSLALPRSTIDEDDIRGGGNDTLRPEDGEVNSGSVEVGDTKDVRLIGGRIAPCRLTFHVRGNVTDRPNWANALEEVSQPAFVTGVVDAPINTGSAAPPPEVAFCADSAASSRAISKR